MGTCAVTGCSGAILVKSRALCRMHYHRLMRTGSVGSVEASRINGGNDRWPKLIRKEPDGCWVWTGSLDKHGYGQFDMREDGKRKNWRAHRWVYTQLVRELGPDETLDHLCRIHACVNPEHLEPVSHAENVARGLAGHHHASKTHCVKGHEFTAENTRFYGPNGRWRDCRECARSSSRAVMRRKRATPPDAHANRDKTHCANGHEFTPENTRRPKRGGRECIECSRARMREYMAKRRAEAKAT